MRKMLLFIVMAGLVFPTMLTANPVSAEIQHKALILSPIDELAPMRTYDLLTINGSLTRAGYTVTYVADTAVTLDLITTQLNNYDLIIWRTNVYEHAHTIYYYVGQLDSAATAEAYASEFASGSLDYSHGFLGASIDFFSNHFGHNSLSNVKLVVLVSSMSSSIASIFLNAGAESVINFAGVFSLQFGIVDYLTGVILRFLSEGYNVADSVSNTMMPLLNLRLRDPLDSLTVPSVVYTGDYAVTIT